VAPKIAHCARFVGDHQGTITGDICGQDRVRMTLRHSCSTVNSAMSF
jgi:hypothetical protein